MRRYFILLSIMLLALPAIAQPFGGNPFSRHGATLPPPRRRSPATDGRPPLFYLGTSTGLNNASGPIGFNIDVPVTPHLSFSTGVGTGTWNYKAHLDGWYYLQPYNRGFAFGGGITCTFGPADSSHAAAANTSSGDANIIQLPQLNAFAAIYYYFNLGRAYNRFFIEAGWSQRVTKELYGIPKGVTIDYNTADLYTYLAPGGPMLGAGFSFGIRKKQY